MIPVPLDLQPEGTREFPMENTIKNKIELFWDPGDYLFIFLKKIKSC